MGSRGRKYDGRRRKGALGPVVSCNRRIREGPDKDWEFGRRVKEVQGTCGRHGQKRANLSNRAGSSANTPTLNEPVASTTPINNNDREQEISTLKEKLVAQEALRDREREQKKTTKAKNGRNTPEDSSEQWSAERRTRKTTKRKG